MADQEYDEMVTRYFADMEEQSRKRVAEAAELIAKFTALVASRGVILGAESFEYIQTLASLPMPTASQGRYCDQ